jgi:hypothetical protein
MKVKGKRLSPSGSVSDVRDHGPNVRKQGVNDIWR